MAEKLSKQEKESKESMVAREWNRFLRVMRRRPDDNGWYDPTQWNWKDGRLLQKPEKKKAVRRGHDS